MLLVVINHHLCTLLIVCTPFTIGCYLLSSSVHVACLYIYILCCLLSSLSSMHAACCLYMLLAVTCCCLLLLTQWNQLWRWVWKSLQCHHVKEFTIKMTWWMPQPERLLEMISIIERPDITELPPPEETLFTPRRAKIKINTKCVIMNIKKSEI